LARASQGCNAGSHQEILGYFEYKYTLTRYTQIRYVLVVAIRSFGNRITEQFYHTGKAKKGAGWVAVKKIALRKLDMLNYAHKLDDLKSPPGNRPERLKGGLAGFHSIRINDQWRIIFRWTDSGPSDVEIIDYH